MLRANWYGRSLLSLCTRANGGMISFTNSTKSMDVRVGGEWIHTMHGPDGKDYPNHIVYREVVEPSRLVYDHISAPHHRTTVIFDDLGDGRTRLTFTMIFDTTEKKRWTGGDLQGGYRIEADFGAVGGLPGKGKQPLERPVIACSRNGAGSADNLSARAVCIAIIVDALSADGADDAPGFVSRASRVGEWGRTPTAR